MPIYITIFFLNYLFYEEQWYQIEIYKIGAALYVFAELLALVIFILDKILF